MLEEEIKAICKDQGNYKLTVFNDFSVPIISKITINGKKHKKINVIR